MSLVGLGGARFPLCRADHGQTSAEYVAITAVAVILAVTIVWLALGAGMTDAVGRIGARIVDFVSGA